MAKIFKLEKPSELLSFFVLIIIMIFSRLWVASLAPDTFSFSAKFVAGDEAIVSLMAKHILRGEFPIFFYGQNWFGSIESFVIAFFFLVMGITTEALKYAPLLMYSLFCTLTYLLARELYSHRVGLISMMWCVVAPARLWEFSLTPIGGYVETPLFSVFLLWVAIKLIRADRRGERIFWYLFAGLIGGLGWWTTPMMFYSLVAVFIFILLKERLDAFKYGILLTLPMFILGSLPFWVFYFTQGFEVQGLAFGYHLHYFPVGIKNFLFKAIPSLYDIERFKEIGFLAFVACALFYGISLILLFLSSAKDFILLFRWRKKKTSGREIFILFFIVTALTYSFSLYSQRVSPHYILAISCLFPIALGHLVIYKFKRLRIYLSGIFVIFLIAQATLIHAFVKDQSAKSVDYYSKMRQLTDFLERNNFDRLYANFYFGSNVICFLSKEKVIASAPYYERYKPYEEILDRANNPGLLDGKEHLLDNFYQTSGGSGLTTNYKDWVWIQHGFKEPKQIYRQIMPEGWQAKSNRDQEGASAAFDRILERGWSTREEQRPGQFYELDLGQIYDLGLIRVLNKGSFHGDFPLEFKLEVSKDGLEWEEIFSHAKGELFYWSGPRPYYWEMGFRWELRLPSTLARFIRMTQLGTRSGHHWVMHEIFVYERMSKEASSYEGLDGLLRFIRNKEFKSVFADRWLSAKIREQVGESIKTMRPYLWPNFKRFTPPSRRVQFSNAAAFVFREGDGDLFMNQMEDYAIDLEEEAFGAYRIYYFKEQDENLLRILDRYPVYYWAGFCMVMFDIESSIYKSEILSLMGEDLFKKGQYVEVMNYLQKALKIYPRHFKAKQGMVSVLKHLARHKDAEFYENQVEEQSVPNIDSQIVFAENVRFHGFNLSQNKVKAGQDFYIKYFWSTKEILPKGIAVFVHFENKDNLFQNDHQLLEQYPSLKFPLKNEIFTEDYKVRIPESMEPGRYTIGIGLFEADSNERWRVTDTKQAHHKGKVTIGEMIVE